MIKTYYKKSKRNYSVLRDAEQKIFFKTDSLWILNEDFSKTDRIKEGAIDLIVLHHHIMLILNINHTMIKFLMTSIWNLQENILLSVIN